jgi:DNA-binding HxlR family transcriptional regulator
MSVSTPKSKRQKGLATLKAVENYTVGTGQKQIEMAHHSQQLIFDALSDGQWHSRKEIKKKTELCSHVLDKHLSAMVENQVISKKIDKESGEYPIPTKYKASQELIEFLQYQTNMDNWIKEIEQKTGMKFGEEAYLQYLRLNQKMQNSE